MSSIGVLGSGTWGTALARMLAVNGHDVTLWSAFIEECNVLNLTRTHKNLPGMVIPKQLNITNDIEEACKSKDILVFAVPSVYVRSTTNKASSYIEDGQIIVDVAKGIEPDTLFTMSEVINDELSKVGKSNCKLVALSGPTHAEEVARDIPTAIVAACEDNNIAKIVQDIFTNTYFRVYTNPDVKGVELCGATKNIIALASGITAGLGYGDNSKAALITRGMAEITRLGKAMGCKEQTFAGLAGIGDLIVTATSQNSRNNRCGYLIGQGVNVQEAIKQIGMVVEGINALPATVQLAKKHQITMPIVEAVNSIVNDGVNPKDIALNLMNRDKKSEVLSSIQYEQIQNNK